MNILFDINHPAHVHLFRNAINILKSQGHKITVTSRDKDVTLQLLDNYKIPHIVLSKAQKGLLGLAGELIWRQLKLLPILIKQKINICVSVTGACNVHVCKLLRIPTLIFYDTEHAKLQNSLAIPFATRYITPDCYEKDEGDRHLRYPSVHELAYLHPNRFQPNPEIFKFLNINPSDKFVILRFVNWNATHDKGQTGMSLGLKRHLILKLSRHAHVFINSENSLAAEFAEYHFDIPPEWIHHVLYYAFLFIGEGATMASECACLGTPAIYINTLKLGYINEENRKYGLVYDLHEEDKILNLALEIIQREDKHEWEKKREFFLTEKTDLTSWMVNIILHYGKGA